MDPDGANEEGRDPVERLSEEFLDRRRRGESIEIEAFAALHPAHAEEIRAIFPTLVRLEGSRTPEPAGSSDRLGRWSIVREVGRGGMGVVYLAEDAATGERAALKLVSREGPDAAARFRREAEAVARVAHPGLCRVLEVAPPGGPLWIALEYLEGETLAQALRRERRARDEGSGTSSSDAGIARWLAMGEQVATALHAAHEAGLVHRDVKPGNIMLTPSGRAVVLDFGLAHGDLDGEQTRITHTGVPVGTPAYMSPEQVRAGTAPLDRRTDVYSLGATLYEALTLEPPFGGPTIASLFSQILASEVEPARRRNPALSRDLEAVLATALEKQPRRRYATARHLADDLARVRRGERVRARPAGPLRRLGRWAVRNPRIATAVGAFTLALMTGLVVALVLLARVEEARDREAAVARHARAQALASASAEVSRSDAMLALLLAREGFRAERNPETLTRLHAAVHGSLERARLAGHGGPVTSVAWDAAGRTVATGCEDGRARLFATDGTLRLTVPSGEAVPAGEVNVALSPDGARLATWAMKGAAHLWKADGTEATRLTESSDPAGEVRFLPDGSIAVVRQSGRITLHAPDGTLRTEWKVPPPAAGHGPVLTGAAFETDPLRVHVIRRDRLALAYDDGGREVARREQAVAATKATVFDRGRLALVTRRPDREADPAAGPEQLTVLAPDGTMLGTVRGTFEDVLLCGGDSWWATWAASTGAQLVSTTANGARQTALDLQRSERPSQLSASPDGSRVFTARQLLDIRPAGVPSTDAQRLWTATGASLAAVTAADDMVATAVFSADGTQLALGRHSGGLATLHSTAPAELATVVPRWRVGDGFRNPIVLSADGDRLVAFEDEEHLVIVGSDGSVRTRISVGAGGTGVARYLAGAPSSDRILVVDSEGATTAYDERGGVVCRVAPSPAAERAFWIGHDGGFVIQVAGPGLRFHAADGTLRAERPGTLLAPGPAYGFPEEGAVFQGPDTVHIVGPDGSPRRTFHLGSGTSTTWYHGSSVGAGVLIDQPTEDRGVSGSCRFLDAEGRTRWQVPVGGFGVQTAVISGDATRVAVVASGGVSLRDAAGKELASLPVRGGVTELAFDPRGERLLAASTVGGVRVWDRDGRLLFDLPEQGGPTNARFSSDGRRITTVTSVMARLYTTDADELEALSARRSTRTLTATERARYAGILDASR